MKMKTGMDMGGCRIDFITARRTAGDMAANPQDDRPETAKEWEAAKDFIF
jgi:hypothetical protein